MKPHLYIVYLLLAIMMSSYSITKMRDKDFEGIIEYAHEYKSSMLNVDSLNKGKESASIYYWKGADYKGIMSGSDSSTYLYKGSEAKCYYTRKDFNGYYCGLDYSKPTDKIIRYEILPNQETILGEKTDLLIVQTENSTTKYYVSKKYKVNPEYYKTHKAYLWDFYMEKAKGGIILKSITEYKNYQVVITATKVTSELLKEDVFYIDKSLVQQCE